jgi:hypothetical protein
MGDIPFSHGLDSTGGAEFRIPHSAFRVPHFGCFFFTGTVLYKTMKCRLLNTEHFTG